MAQILNTLQKEIANKYQVFDPNNPVHVESYYNLRYNGKQLDVRFSLEEPFYDVISMMQFKMAEEWVKKFGSVKHDFVVRP